MAETPSTDEAAAAATSPENAPLPSEPAPSSEAPATESKELSDAPPPSPPAPITITIPSYSSWFSFDSIHETERRNVPDFFVNPRSASRNPKAYKYLRDAIIRKFREDPSRDITYTEVRKTLVADVVSIRLVFDFLEQWGLINYHGAEVKLNPKDVEREKESKSGVNGLLSPPLDSPFEKKESVKKVCGGCKAVCNLACFACDKVDLILCARCFVRGNYQGGLNSGDFKRVDISEETKMDWTEKATLHLLEAVLQFGDDWKKVAEHVGGRSEKECVIQFLKLPFGEQFAGPSDPGEVDDYHHKKDHLNAEAGEATSALSSPTKRQCPTPLADVSNPLLTQAAFLAALVGAKVAKGAAQAAVAALSEVNFGVDAEINGDMGTLSKETDQEGAINAKDHTGAGALEAAVSEARALLEKEEQEVEQSISNIVEVQLKEIHEKIVRYESLEKLMEKEWQQLNNMRNQLFADELTFLQHKHPLRFAEKGEEKIKSLDSIP